MTTIEDYILLKAKIDLLEKKKQSEQSSKLYWIRKYERAKIDGCPDYKASVRTKEQREANKKSIGQWIDSDKNERPRLVDLADELFMSHANVKRVIIVIKKEREAINND